MRIRDCFTLKYFTLKVPSYSISWNVDELHLLRKSHLYCFSWAKQYLNFNLDWTLNFVCETVFSEIYSNIRTNYWRGAALFRLLIWDCLFRLHYYSCWPSISAGLSPTNNPGMHLVPSNQSSVPRASDGFPLAYRNF